MKVCLAKDIWLEPDVYGFQLKRVIFFTNKKGEAAQREELIGFYPDLRLAALRVLRLAEASDEIASVQALIEKIDEATKKITSACQLAVRESMRAPGVSLPADDQLLVIERPKSS